MDIRTGELYSLDEIARMSEERAEEELRRHMVVIPAEELRKIRPLCLADRIAWVRKYKETLYAAKPVPACLPFGSDN